ncbi:uncharacterized protein LOC143530995 isoform X2 [Bidens hawaiensis]
MGQRNMLYTGPPLETEHGRIHPEPSVVPYGGLPSFPQPTNNNLTILPGFNPQHLPENHGPLPPGITQFNGPDHPHSHPHLHHPANNVYMTPNGARVFQPAINHGIQNPFIDVFKRKNAEGFPGNMQYFYPTPGSSSSGAIGVDPVLAHNSGHLIPGNYGGQHIQTVLWNHGPGLPYLQGPIPGAFVHPAAVTPHPGPHTIHHPPPSQPPMQGPNIDFHSQVASSSRRLPTNPFQNGIELPMPRFVGPAQPTGVRVFQPHRRELMVEATARHRAFPHLRVLPEDGVAIFDISGYREAGHSVDHLRDMRLDIDHMSYEELLALGEQIGSAGSGLSDAFILEHLKTKVLASSKSSSEPEDASSADQELNSCVICQTDYDEKEQIGVLDCGHEYHVECVKKWLTVKNTCPVCKSTGLAAKATQS